jgi:hypothetical protein
VAGFKLPNMAMVQVWATLHSAAAGIYGKKKFLDFTLIFEKFRLF